MVLSILRKPLSFVGAVVLFVGQPVSIAWAELPAAPPPLSEYGVLPQFEDAAISPSGKYIVSAIWNGGKRFLVITDDGERPIRTLPVDGVKLRDIRWAGDSHVILTISQTDDLGPGWRAENIEVDKVISIPVAGGDVKVLFEGQRDIANGVFGAYGVRKVDGEWRMFNGGVELTRVGGFDFRLDHFRPSLFSIDPATLKADRIDPAARPGEYMDWLIGPDGEIAASLRGTYSSGAWEIRDAANRKLLSGRDPQGRTGLVSMGRNAGEILFSEFSEERDDNVWYTLSLADGTQTETFSGIDVTRLYLDRTTGLLIGYREGTTKRRNIFFDKDRARISSKIDQAFAGLNVSFVDWTPDMSRVILSVDGKGQAGNWYLVDIATLRAEMLGMERPRIAADQIGAVSLVDYKASDGLAMDGVLTLPPGRDPKNLPVVILPHGGPASYSTVTFDWWAQAFASRGYAVFQPNFRGSTNRDAAFQRAGDGEWGGKMQTDISDGLAMLAEKGIVDPERACIVGASYGGYAALAGVTLQQGIYRCAVSVAGLSDLPLMRRTELYETGNNRMLKRSLERQLGPSRDLKDVSPRTFADRADAPILLIHGRDDTVVRFEQSVKMADALKDAGKPYEFVELAGEDHWLSNADTRLRMLDAAVGFVARHNPAN